MAERRLWLGETDLSSGKQEIIQRVRRACGYERLKK